MNVPPLAAIFGCAGPSLAREEAAFFREADPWGFILFARNVEHPAQVARLTADLRAAVGRDAPILVDQEGGRVQRLRAPHWREWLPPLDQAGQVAAGALSRSFWLRGRVIAAELAAVGIDTCCAPSGDIAGPATHPFLKNRCYGTAAASVIPPARAMADGLLAGGVLPVVKHIPGHGRATVDSHHEPPRVQAALSDLRASDFAVFAALADLPMGMTGHIVFDAIDPARPATASPEAIAFIRDEIGFGGLLMTDDISMEALSGTVADRSRAARAAGVDVVLHCNGRLHEMAEVAQAAGALSGAAADRAARALALRRGAVPVDAAELTAELHAMLAAGAHG